MRAHLMQRPERRTTLLCMSALIAACLTPPAIAVFESSMALHMLVQLPLLAVAGMLVAKNSSAHLHRFLLRWDPRAAIALIVGSGWLFFWMLPMSLDLATIDPGYRVLKIVSVPFGVGLSFYWVWRRASPLLKIMLLFETWASIARLGWLYLESPVQLCSRYLLSEQLQVGQFLIAVSAVLGAAALIWGIFGSFSNVQIAQ